MLTILLIIDPQNDFCARNGTLAVPGAEASMSRLARMIEAQADKIDQIIVTLDSHQELHIANPTWWRDAAGNMPAPFTIISADDVQSGRWSPRRPDAKSANWSLHYLRELEKAGKFPHTIWPEHCLIGTEGHAVAHPLQEALHYWKCRRLSTVHYVTKGSNPFTEHFGAFQAEVPDPMDPSTQLNADLVSRIERGGSRILCAGEALTHCLMTSLQQLMFSFQDPAVIGRMELLRDAADPIPDPPSAPGLFSGALARFLEDARRAGLKETTTQAAF